MTGYLQRISGEIPNTFRQVDIQLDGKNLIITGGNGSGKTSFIKGLSDKIDLLIRQKKMADLPQLKADLKLYNSHVSSQQKGTTQYQNYISAIKITEDSIKSIESGIQIDIPDYLNLSAEYDEKKSVICFFQAQRISQIQPATGATALSNKDLQQTENAGVKFEQHLVNLKTRSSFALTEDKNQKLHNEISLWFLEFEKDLKYLMEDESTRLDFKPQEFKFYIAQDGKKSYTLQTLSSGYSAIFNILADLIVKTEFFEVSPKELKGIVFIDEIDAHLHVSLQRKIFPFLTRSFPKVQFIITTHSPFVITSVNNAVIYDIKNQEQISEDLSMYSYDAIVEGLLGVPAISREMEEEMEQLVVLLEQGFDKQAEIQVIVNKMRPHEDHLSDEAQVIYQKAIYFILKLKNKKDGVNV